MLGVLGWGSLSLFDLSSSVGFFFQPETSSLGCLYSLFVLLSFCARCCVLLMNIYNTHTHKMDIETRCFFYDYDEMDGLGLFFLSFTCNLSFVSPPNPRSFDARSCGCWVGGVAENRGLYDIYCYFFLVCMCVCRGGRRWGIGGGVMEFFGFASGGDDGDHEVVINGIIPELDLILFWCIFLSWLINARGKVGVVVITRDRAMSNLSQSTKP